MPRGPPSTGRPPSGLLDPIRARTRSRRPDRKRRDAKESVLRLVGDQKARDLLLRNQAAVSVPCPVLIDIAKNAAVLVKNDSLAGTSRFDPCDQSAVSVVAFLCYHGARLPFLPVPTHPSPVWGN